MLICTGGCSSGGGSSGEVVCGSGGSSGEGSRGGVW